MEFRINICDISRIKLKVKGSVFAPSPNVDVTASLAAVQSQNKNASYSAKISNNAPAVELKLAEILKHGPSV